jgi:hypothetical protein
MIGVVFAALRAVSARPALRRVFLAILAVLALCGALAAYVARERSDAVQSVRRDLDFQQSKEVKNAIERSAPGPRPSGSEFVECLRRAGPGCF